MCIRDSNKDNYRPLASPMVTETNHKVKQLITDLHNGDHIDMTKKSCSETLVTTFKGIVLLHNSSYIDITDFGNVKNLMQIF